MTTNRLRGTWITQLLRLGTPLTEVKEMARQKNRETTLGYYELPSEVRREAQEKIAKEMGFHEINN